jgi:hypothetical protein
MSAGGQLRVDRRVADHPALQQSLALAVLHVIVVHQPATNRPLVGQEYLNGIQRVIIS